MSQQKSVSDNSNLNDEWFSLDKKSLRDPLDLTEIPEIIPQQSKAMSDQAALAARTNTLEKKISDLKKQIKILNTQTNSFSSEVKNHSQKLEKQQKILSKIQDANTEMIKLKDELKSDKLQAIQILAIFVAFFTFVSVEFQLFANTNDALEVLGLSALLMGSLLIFVCLVLKAVDGQEVKEKAARWSWVNKNRMFITALVLFAIGVGCFTYLKFDTTNDTSDVCQALRNKLINDKMSESEMHEAAAIYSSASCASSK